MPFSVGQTVRFKISVEAGRPGETRPATEAERAARASGYPTVGNMTVVMDRGATVDVSWDGGAIEAAASSLEPV